MSQVSHDATWIHRHAESHDRNHDTSEKGTVNVIQKHADDVPEKEINVDKRQNEITQDLGIKTDNLKKYTNKRNSDGVPCDLKLKINTINPYNLKNNEEINRKNAKVKILSNKKRHSKQHRRFVESSLSKIYLAKRTARKNLQDKYKKRNRAAVERLSAKIVWKRQNEDVWKNSNVKRTNGKLRRKIKWFWHSGILVSLIMLNAVGLSSAGDTSGFSPALTSRMIATFLGYPSTCTLGAEVRPCTLTLSCWLRGGTRLRGCGGWLFSCCGPPEPSRDGFDNSIQSSDWKYKMSPPKLRQVPHRSVMPNNVFRRRVDDDSTQMDCGLPSSRILQKRIIGGREARFAEFPWQAHVRISEFQCGGVLVSRRFVATAAHCVSRAPPRDIAVWLGAVDTSATHHPARKLGVVQKILHPLFQFRMTQPDRYDIALLKLSRLITYMSHILPICLPDHGMELRGRSGVIAGWGKTDASNGHTGTNLLRSATVPILSKEQCINWHQSKQISVEIHSEMICAGHSDGHQDACLGDSGGPLIVLDNGRYYLVGITSAGFGCGVDHQPGIYHNVKVTASWIRGVIAPSVNYDNNF